MPRTCTSLVHPVGTLVANLRQAIRRGLINVLVIALRENSQRETGDPRSPEARYIVSAALQSHTPPSSTVQLRLHFHVQGTYMVGQWVRLNTS